MSAPAGDMRRAADGEGMILEVAGFGITLGQAAGGEKQQVKSYPRVCGLFFDGVELGFNFLTGADYAGYPAEAGDFLDVKGGNSFHFGITPVGLSVALDRKRRFEFSTGLRYTVDNYRLSDNSITLGREGGMIVPRRWTRRPTSRNSASRRWAFRCSSRSTRSGICALPSWGIATSRSGPTRSIRSRRRRVPFPASIPSGSDSEARFPTADSVCMSATA